MAMQHKTSLVWLRRDLRLHDHAVLSHATENSQEVLLVFVFDTEILRNLKDKSDKRVFFILESVKELNDKLKKYGSSLIIRHGNPVTEIPKLAKELGVEAVFAGKDYEPYAKKRDQSVAKSLEALKIKFQSLKDHVIFEELEVHTLSQQAFKVFTPYKNAWLKSIRKAHIADQKVNTSRFSKRKDLQHWNQVESIEDIGFKNTEILIAPGENEGQKRLKAFLKKINDYKKERDIPSLDATSGLSMHFRFGTVSIRSAVRACQEVRSEGSRTWLSELIWRDFYQMVLDQNPHVVKHAYRAEYDKIKWPGEPAHFEAWKNGMTGFPIVDAAMRYFKETGWMHNRLRMIVASFLVKDLLIDWRKGESYFAEKLLDYDLAANNGGWQWSASTGCDAQPYFRIFNPDSQAKRFDPEGIFIKTHLPDLNKNYPPPIVDHKIQREKALALFKKL